jgi:hypothetical protein
MPISSDSPLKVSSDVKDLVRYAAAVFECTQAEFVEKAVAEYLREHEAEVSQRADLMRARIAELSEP